MRFPFAPAVGFGFSLGENVVIVHWHISEQPTIRKKKYNPTDPSFTLAFHSLGPCDSTYCGAKKKLYCNILVTQAAQGSLVALQISLGTCFTDGLSRFNLEVQLEYVIYSLQ